MNYELHKKANINLVCKAISELYFEELLPITFKGHIATLRINSLIEYIFEYKKSIYNHLIIDPDSLLKNDKRDINAASFFREIEEFTQMGPITLSHFIYELNNTLYSDEVILNNRNNFNGQLNQRNLDRLTNGHPKILLNKGRIGFNPIDLEKYTPEQSTGFSLYWLAIKKDSPNLKQYFCNLKNLELLHNHLTDTEKDLWFKKADPKEYILFPCHPWQWKNYLKIQLHSQISQGQILLLGESKREYLPEMSIRTVKDSKLDLTTELKLSLNILNTSAYRGISPTMIKLGPLISELLQSLIDSDEILKNANLSILDEKISCSFVNPDYQELNESPYRFIESLGFILRSNVESKLTTNEMALMTGTLFTFLNDKEIVINELIKKSNIKTEEWLTKYTEKVIIPLYHLQLKYGIGLVSHGQNIVLKLKDYIPCGLIIKDFQGDLRLSNESPFASIEELSDIKKLPKEHLIHDLYTGHFITTLRFISPYLEKDKIIDEYDFYKIIRNAISQYLQENFPDLPLENSVSLLRFKFEKIILNKVRFSMGYQDTSERLLPSLGTDILNPLSPKFSRATL